ncbi:hypothetical protein MUK51_12285 [Sphingobacterium faecium]|uniref:hypothetical protein n=1 Tax=Sphingobacterium faecium TaxID=34087 RepID=UPI0021B64C48|nr:hypothetical protein [Sphingobacterium faecium]UXD68001.1 hypothetical protein MUK51_12285 [Sphingobacterium faecium]
MSAKNSDLSNPKYGYDMVVATTQTSVNATMKEWLSKYSGKPFIQAYIYDPSANNGSGGPALTNYDELVAKLGFDPFTIPENTPMTDPHLVKLLEERFMFAFYTELGLPDFPLEKIPPIIEFNKEGSYVTYNMVAKTFKIVVIQPGLYGPATWINLNQQDATDPWVFSFTIDLDLRTDNINNHFSNLPKETQKEIKNLGIDMFSVQQLFLDLNAASLSDSVTIKGLDKNSVAFVYLNQIFINTYVAQISKDGGIMLGYSVVSKEEFPKNVSIIPTDMNFMISSYKDSSGKATPDYNGYTLNYLIMSKGRPLPAPVQFSWNWVEKDQVSQYAGVMAVNRNTFITYLHHLLSQGLGTIARKPTTYFHINCIECGIRWGYEAEETPQTYNIVNQNGAHVLTYSYNKRAFDDDSQYCGIYGTWGNFEAKYNVQSDVYLEGTSIRIETTTTMWMHINVCGGVTEGNFAKKSSTTLYTLGVDAYGRITVSTNGPKITDHSEAVDPSWWTKFLTLGAIDDMVDTVKNSVKGWLEGFLAADAGRIQQMLNSSSGWTFPGARTYAFMNAQFSEHQDLVTNVLYISPKTDRKVIAQMLALVKSEPEILLERADSLEKLLVHKIPQLSALIGEMEHN